MNCGSMTELMLQVWLLISIQVVTAYPSYLTVFNNELYFKAETELTVMNYGNMMELMLQVWLLISDLEVAVVKSVI